MSRFKWVSLYLITAGLGLTFAYFLSVGFMGQAISQAPPPPSDGSLPAEFLNEIEGGAPGAPPAAPAIEPSTPQPPPPIEDLPGAPQGVTDPTAEPMPTVADPSAPPSAPEAQPPEMTASPETANVPVPPGGYVYDPTGRRDPFRPYRMIRTERQGPTVLVEPLQTFDLEQMSVVGIMWDIRAPRALVRDSDGKLHTVVKNTKIGRNNGYVATIREGEIVVIEILDDEGKPVKRTKVLEFRK